MLARSYLIESSSKLRVIRTGNKGSAEFDFGPYQTTHFGVTCHWVTKILHFWTWISLKPVAQSWSNFMCNIIGVGERLHKVLGQIGLKPWFPWQQKAPNDLSHWLIMEKMMSPPFLGCFWSDPPFKLVYLWSQLASLDQILCVTSLGLGKGCIMFWGRLDQSSGAHGNRKPPSTYNGENGVSTFSRLLLIRSFLYLHVTRTCIKSRTSSNFGQRSDHWLRS